MSEPAYTPKFLADVDKFIALANEMAKGRNTGEISAALLFAAGRYNAFNFVSKGGTDADKAEAVRYYTEEYRKAFTQNLAGVVGSLVDEKKR